MSSVGSEGSESSNSSRAGEIVKTGYLKKLKTMKKKFFVLRADSSSTQACLEYYDTGKKWKNNHPPKRSIILRNCFNINRRTDTKHKYVIALFTGNDCFGIVLDCEDDMLDWLKLLLMYQQGEDMVDCGSLKPYYEQVWKVTIQKKELACKHNLSGVYLLCLTECTLSLVKHATEEEQDMKHYEFSLQSIRRCGNLDAFFYMELGQASCLGSGNLWMQAEDSNTAHHMHSVIMNACTNCPKKELAPKSRSRSSSANEASKPISFGRKWPSSGDDSLSVISHAKSQCHQEHTTPVGHSVSSVGEGNHHHHHNLASVPYSPYPPIRRASTGTRPVTAGPALLSSARTNSSHTGRERCDSLPTRPRMTLDSLSHARSGNTVSHLTPVSGRPHSMYTRGIFSPSGCSHPTSPMSATYSTDSAGSSLSVDGDSENCSEMESFRKIILEENAEDYVQWGGNQNKNFLAENIPHMNNTCRNIKTICHHSSSNSQSSCSPCSSSPMDAAGYMPMSPESIAENRNRQQLNRSYDSVNHSRESSIHEDVGEGYVPMAPLSVDTGYMSMDQSSRKPGDLSPGLSSCSITSGTPSTDARYLLDKVSSYLTPSDDDIIFNVRQTRAYSTGSKPDGSHNKFVRCDSADGLRVRAFSVGSRCGTHMPPTPRRTPASTSTSSIEPCDDLMEIDFSANKLRHRHIRTRMKHQNSPSTCGGVVHTSNEKLTVPHSTASLMFNDGYMDMSPKSSPKLESFCDSRSYSLDSSANVSPPRLSKHLMGRSAPISVGYGTKQAYAKGSPSTSGCLEKVVEAESQGSNSSSKLRLSDEESSYMDMKPGVYDVPDGVPKVTAVIATASDLHVRKENFTVLDPSGSRTSNTCATLPHIKQPLIDTEGKHFKNMSADKSNGIGTPDGYVDMTFKGRRVENQTAKLVARIPEKTPEGYVDMSFKGSRKNLVDSNSVAKVAEKTPTCCAGKENQLLDPRQSSKPIAIQQSKCKRSVGSGFFRRKQSDEQATSKPNFLPLGLSISNSFASLGRKNKKTCQKKDKAAESPATSNSGTIFPLSPDRTPSLDYDPKSKCAISATGESIRLTCDYEAQSLERVDEMVNWSRRCSEDDQLGEYTVMTPGVAPLQRKKSEPACLSYSLNRVNLKSDQARGKILHRSTSVPSAMSAMKNRCPSFSEFGRTECCQEVEDRSENKTTRGSNRMDVDVAETPREATLNLVDVPNAFAGENANVIRLREKVMYATLELPPASEQDENSVKDESESSSNAKIPDQSNLTYAQIDFEKASSSSSN